MGLIADYVEANRERAHKGEIDPCMIVDPKHVLRYRYASLRNTMHEYSSVASDPQRQNLLENDLKKRIAELEVVKVHYILGEKAILEVLNRYQLESDMMADSLKELLFQMQAAYIGVCNILQELRCSFRNGYTFEKISMDEDAIRRRLLNLLLNSIVEFMRNDRAMDTSSLRKIICDCASLIRVLEDESYPRADKEVVQSYFARELSMKQSSVRCPNCKEALYSDLLYCLNCYQNCYERNSYHE